MPAVSVRETMEQVAELSPRTFCTFSREFPSLGSTELLTGSDPDSGRGPAHSLVRRVVPGSPDFASRRTGRSVSNSLSGRDWELDQVPPVGDPTHMAQIARDRRVSTGEVQPYRPPMTRGGVSRCSWAWKWASFRSRSGAFQQHMVEKFSPHRPDQALHEWV
jgi:hypothetical protein